MTPVKLIDKLIFGANAEKKFLNERSDVALHNLLLLTCDTTDDELLLFLEGLEMLIFSMLA